MKGCSSVEVPSPEDEEELAKFRAFMTRLHERPSESAQHAYAEIYGEVVFEDRGEL